MKKFIILIMLVFVSSVAFGMSLSDEQFDNLDYIDAKVREAYPQFKGFNGPQNAILIYGVSEKAIEDVIRTIDFDKVNAERYEIEQEYLEVQEEIIDNAITDVESSGTKLKHKDKVKERLLKEVK